MGKKQLYRYFKQQLCEISHGKNLGIVKKAKPLERKWIYSDSNVKQRPMARIYKTVYDWVDS